MEIGCNTDVPKKFIKLQDVIALVAQRASAPGVNHKENNAKEGEMIWLRKG